MESLVSAIESNPGRKNSDCCVKLTKNNKMTAPCLADKIIMLLSHI